MNLISPGAATVAPNEDGILHSLNTIHIYI